MTTTGAIHPKKERLKRFAHFLAGFIILMHAYERFESNHRSYLFFLVSAIIFFMVAAFHHKLVQKFRMVELVFVVIESILTLIIAYEYFDAGKKYIPYFYLLASLLRIISIFMLYFKEKRQRGSL